MLYRVDADTREFLVAQPESGMGYQLVQTKDDGDRFLVFNTELGVRVEELHELHDLGAVQADHGSHVTIGSDSPILPIDVQSIIVITHGSYRSTSGTDEIFVRYSAFRNDRRIRSDGSLVSGTYVTTVNDAYCWGRRFGWTGLAVVGRYALPNPTPAVHQVLVKPAQRIPILCGCVTPEYGQGGGGVEVRFQNDTPSGTVIRRGVIPER